MTEMTDLSMDRDELLLVTGLSGAGKSSALKMLEDMGWEVIDNLPLVLLPGLLERNDGEGSKRRFLAVGIDSRTRDFDPDALDEQLTSLRHRGGINVRFCYFTCDPDVLQNRFTETRRRHPMARDRTVADGIRIEQEMFDTLRDRVDRVIDTTNLSLPDLRAHLRRLFDISDDQRVQIHVVSFSFRRGLPRAADLVFDVRFLDNPYYVPHLRAGTGLDAPVQAHIQTDSAWTPFIDKLEDMLSFLLPRYVSEGKSYLTIAIGCTGGRHRSVFTTEEIARRLRGDDTRVTVRHRDLP
ncbi:MAG: RNase adapter RapZ [Minwuia sp.]|nr:RNase adapter RapZ [Minwuia sp.]